MNFEHILPILTLLLGWSLNSLAPIFQERRDNRKAVGKALADLLEIRHDLFARQLMMEQVKTLCALAAVDERIAFGVLTKCLPQPNHLSKRYDEAVTLIASSNPLLGFQLRSKDYISKVSSMLSQIENQAGQSISMFSEMEAQVYRIAIPHINEVIVDLSREHGFFTGFRIRRFLKKGMIVPKEAEDLLSSLKAEIEKMRSAGELASQTQIAQPINQHNF